MKSRSEWLGIPVHALGALFIARWLAIAGFSISMLVFGVYSIAMLGQRFNLITGGEYRRIVKPDHSESAKLKQMNTLIVEQKGTISMLQEEVDNINSMLEFEKAMRGKLEKKLEEQAKTIGKLNSDIDRLESEKSKLKAMADVAKADLKLAEAKIKAEQSTRIQAERELKRALAKIKVTEKDAKAAQSALDGATSRVQRLDHRIFNSRQFWRPTRRIHGSAAQVYQKLLERFRKQAIRPSACRLVKAQCK